MYAVFMDYELDGVRNTVVLGCSIEPSKIEAEFYLGKMVCCPDCPWDLWEVGEDDLPWGYKFQTYYVAAYDPDQPMIGVH